MVFLKRVGFVFIVSLLVLSKTDVILAQADTYSISKHTIFTEIAGATFGLSINYEFNYAQRFGSRIGVGLLLADDDFLGEGYYYCEKVDFRRESRFDDDPDLVSSSNCSPALFKTFNHYTPLYKDEVLGVFLELNAGPAIYLIHGELDAFITSNIGIRLDYDGIIFRAGYNPLYNFEYVFHSFGVSFGLSFDRMNRILSRF